MTCWRDSTHVKLVLAERRRRGVDLWIRFRAYMHAYGDAAVYALAALIPYQDVVCSGLGAVFTCSDLLTTSFLELSVRPTTTAHRVCSAGYTP